MILLDTNVLSEVMRKEPSVIVLSGLDAQPVEQIWVCAISRAEVFLGITLLAEGKRRRANMPVALQRAMNALIGRVAAQTRRKQMGCWVL